MDTATQPLSPQELSDLEVEAGHSFTSEESAHVFRLTKLHREAVEHMLSDNKVEEEMTGRTPGLCPPCG